MADVRSLLRQQRAARRIEHPHAAYSDAGKLLCTLCREHVKAETLWDGHIKSDGHRKRHQDVDEQKKKQADEEQDQENGEKDGEEAEGSTSRATSQKRKLLDNDSMDEDSEPTEDGARRKRNRADVADSADTASPASGASSSAKEPARTPPTLARRSSATPSHGVELQIPSRPATPARSSSTPGPGAAAGSFFPAQAGSTAAKTLPSRQASTLLAAATSSSTPSTTAQPGPAVDEDEWAAFEADIASASLPAAAADDAVISAAPMTAEESAAAAAAKANEQNTEEPVDASMADDREEAARALEDEFDDMQAFEARVQKLKTQREALAAARKRSASQSQETAVDAKRLRGLDKENVTAAAGGEAVADEDESSEDDDDDDWDGFRFRTAA